jgi:hypothetical protein
MMSKKILIALSLILGFVSADAQQAWTKEKGKYFALGGFSYLGYNQLFGDDRAELVPLDRSVTDLSFNLYSEYGLTDYLTATVQLPFKFSVTNLESTSSIDAGSKFGLSNINASLTGRLYKKGGFVVSTKLRAALPTGSFDAVTGIRTGFDATTIAPTLLLGSGTQHFFTSAEFGREFRNNGYADRTQFGWQIGKWFANKKLLAIVAIEGFLTTEESTYDDGSSSKTGLYLADQSYVSPQLKLGYYFKPNRTLWFSFGAGLPGTANIGASPGISFSYSQTNE